MEIKVNKLQIRGICSALLILINAGYSASSTSKPINSLKNATTLSSSVRNTTKIAASLSISDIETTTITQDSTQLLPIEQITKAPKYECNSPLCISKCCPKGYLRDIYGGCANVTKYNIKDWTLDPNLIDTSSVEIIYTIPILSEEEREQNFYCPLHEYYEFSLQNDGTVFVNEIKQYIEPKMYCLDNFYNEESNKTVVAGFFCYKQIVKTEFEKTMDKVLTIALGVSAVFLLCILLLYLITPDRKDLQSKCTISSCVSLFFGFVAIVMNSTNIVHHLDDNQCVALAIASQFFMLSFYFWLSIMCFEISRIMRGTVRLLSYKELTKSEWRYFCYCIIAWGGPLIISIVTVVMQYLSKNLPYEIEKYLIRPDIGNGRCWFRESGGAIYAYYYGIEISIHVLNAIFMGHTTYLLYTEQMMCLCHKRNSLIRIRSHSTKNYLSMFKQQLSIYLLFLFIWVLNSVSLVNPRSYFWRTVDVIVGLQGVFLFIIVIRPKKFSLLRIAAERVSSMVKEFSMRISSNKRALVITTPETSAASKSSSAEAKF